MNAGRGPAQGTVTAGTGRAGCVEGYQCRPDFSETLLAALRAPGEEP